jgi:hypothetical protein
MARFDWIDQNGDGLDQKDRIQKHDLKERASKENEQTRRLRERVQADEHTRINNYSEGYCYGCSKNDKIISTLVYWCAECIEKKGQEGLMALIIKKTSWELCDKCETWKFDECWQINCSLCDRCMRRLNKIHKAYRAKGGRAGAPDERKKRSIYGKDMNELTGNGITRDQTKDQSFALG